MIFLYFGAFCDVCLNFVFCIQTLLLYFVLSLALCCLTSEPTKTHSCDGLPCFLTLYSVFCEFYIIKADAAVAEYSNVCCFPDLNPMLSCLSVFRILCLAYIDVIAYSSSIN